MADMVTQKNIAALVTTRLASPFAAIVAGGAGNGVSVVGPAIQRSLIGMPRTVALVLAYTTTLAATKTLALAGLRLDHSPDGATWAPFTTFTDPGVVQTGPTGGGTVNASLELSVFMSGANDYIRAAFTPTLSNTATDTATLVAILTLGGFDRLPAPA